MGKANQMCLAVLFILVSASLSPAADDAFAGHLRAGIEEVRQANCPAAMSGLEAL